MVSMTATNLAQKIRIYPPGNPFFNSQFDFLRYDNEKILGGSRKPPPLSGSKIRTKRNTEGMAGFMLFQITKKGNEKFQLWQK